MGRPSKFSDELADDICERLAEGESLRSICRDDGMPRLATIFRWLADPRMASFRDQYERAREAQADTYADEIVDIADGVAAAREGVGPDPVRDRLAVDARKWVASKLKPKRYGDRQLLGSDPENPLPSTPLLDASRLSAEALREIVNAAREADAG